jgi:DNA-binding IscR family transcriptional regulator
MRVWGFLTNHAHVVIQVAREPRSRVREIAASAGITERATHAVLQDLRQAGVIRTERDGRQNVNQVDVTALGAHRPWGASNMPIPKELIDATVSGLAHVASSEAGVTRTAGRRARGAAAPSSNGSERKWGFLTTHALILIHVTQHPRSTVREIASSVGITERAAYAVLLDLRESAIIERTREGRRNRHSVNFDRLATFRREGTAPDLVPPTFVSFLLKALLPLRP